MKTIYGLGAVAVFTAWASVAQAMEDIDAAGAVCAAMDNTGLLSEECEVSGWGSVSVSIDMNSSEARKFCAGVVQEIATKHHFQTEWKLIVKSPYSGDNAIATCKFR